MGNFLKNGKNIRVLNNGLAINMRHSRVPERQFYLLNGEKTYGDYRFHNQAAPVILSGYHLCLCC